MSTTNPSNKRHPAARRVVVTGGTGFIGRHVLERLAQEDLSVVAICRSADLPVSASPRLKWVHGDLQEISDDLFDRLERPQLLIHLAWGGLPNYTARFHLDEEAPLQYRWLKSLIAQGLPQLLVTGTCFEYGLTEGKLTESIETKPHTYYGQAKDNLRRKLEALQKEKHFDLCWARLFYTFGEGQNPSSLYSQLKRALSEGLSSFDMSEGNQERDFLPVKRLVDILVRLALHTPDAGVVNVCSGEPRSIRSLVVEWIEGSGRQIALNLGHYPYTDYEPMSFYGDVRKLHSLLTEKSP